MQHSLRTWRVSPIQKGRNKKRTYPKLLLPVRGHETLLRLLGFGSLFEAGADLRPLPLGLRLFPLLFLHFSCETPVKHLIWESPEASRETRIRKVLRNSNSSNTFRTHIPPLSAKFLRVLALRASAVTKFTIIAATNSSKWIYLEIL